jgi:two-component system chemotaxis sensor kinase CheA
VNELFRNETVPQRESTGPSLERLPERVDKCTRRRVVRELLLLLLAHSATMAMDALINDFLQESAENLNRLDHEFVDLERDPQNKELLASIFRTIHTIKGTCGFLGFTKLETLTHAGESLLSMLGAGELALNAAIANTLLEMVDAIRAILQEIEAGGTEGAHEYPELIERLKELQQMPGLAQAEVESGAAAVKAMPTAPVEAAPVPPPVAEMVEKEIHEKKAEAAGTPAKREKSSVAAENPAANAKKPKQEGAIRVDVNLLENQMNLVSELVLLRNRLLQKTANAEDRELEVTVHGLNLVTSELRKNVMKARMQPVSQLYEKLPRLVRDIAKDLKKRCSWRPRAGKRNWTRRCWRRSRIPSPISCETPWIRGSNCRNSGWLQANRSKG